MATRCLWIRTTTGRSRKALIKELIPELEKKFNLIAQPSARIVTGHSSGGWASLWLATEYPDVFGACWSSSPDPVDFRRFEHVNIYQDANMYVDANGKEFESAQFGGRVTMTIRQENGMEQVLGTHNDTQQQWDSWQACWGHRDTDGGVKPLYDAITGQIDHTEAESYRRYDIGDRLRKDPKRFVPIFRNNIRVVCGAGHVLPERSGRAAASRSGETRCESARARRVPEARTGRSSIRDRQPRDAGVGAGDDGPSAPRGACEVSVMRSCDCTP